MKMKSLINRKLDHTSSIKAKTVAWIIFSYIYPIAVLLFNVFVFSFIDPIFKWFRVANIEGLIPQIVGVLIYLGPSVVIILVQEIRARIKFLHLLAIITLVVPITIILAIFFSCSHGKVCL